MSRASLLIHDLNAELYYQLVQTSLQIVDAAGSWEAVVLTEQAETLTRFIDHPHAVGTHE